MAPLDVVGERDRASIPVERKFTLIDCDMHPKLRSLSDLFPYLPERWRQRIGVKEPGKKQDPGTRRNVFSVPNRFYFHPEGASRLDAIGPEGGPPGSDFETTKSQLLDKYRIDYAIIVGQDCTGLSGIPDADLAAAFASAYNDWVLDAWCSRDPRFKAAIWVSPRDPHLAAQEIDRLGDHPDCVQVQISPMNILLGQRFFYPIYEAAVRHGLPVAIHGGAESSGVNDPLLAGGTPSYYIELHSGLPQLGWAHITSLICEGVFERFPTMKFILQEMGYAWVPGLMWRLDMDWRSLRTEVPWVKRPPSEYIIDHVRFTSQPVEEPPRPEYQRQILEMIVAEKTIIFASDYPHWDFDDPRQILNEVSESLRRRIFYENALEIFKF